MKTHKLIIDDKDVFVSQRGDVFKVVKPIKNDDGSINWFNLIVGGSWWNLGVVIFVIIIILGLLQEYSTNIKILQEQIKLCQNIRMLP